MAEGGVVVMTNEKTASVYKSGPLRCKSSFSANRIDLSE